MRWRTWQNAESYDLFVRHREIYPWLNRNLVEMADLDDARGVLDLGCGTGATTLACLARLGPDAEIVGVDASEEMIGVARCNVLDKRARFVVAPAAAIGDLEGAFDRVVSNAAFFQFPAPDAVLRALAGVTVAGARLVFNVPAQRLAGETVPIHPFQMALFREIRKAGGGEALVRAVDLDTAAICRSAAAQGFARLAIERRVWEGRQDELMELMTIPAMLEPLTPGWNDDRRNQVLERARQSADPEEVVTVPWVFFRFERAS